MRRTVALVAALMLAGCGATMPEPRGPADLDVPPDFAADYRPPPGTAETWWKGFRDPELDTLVEQALADNLEIEAALARLRRAQALVRAERSDLLPSLDATGSVDATIDSSGDTGTRANAGLLGFFQPDISGRLSAEVRAALARASASDYFVAEQRRLVAAAVANQYIELRRTGARLALLEQSTELQQQTLRIVTLRFEAGLSANLDVRRAAADLARTRAQKGLLDLARARSSHSLAVLTGDPPSEIPPLAVEAGIPEYEGGPPRGTPADLLRRRADLLVAEAELVEAAALTGAERADLLPTLTIPGDITAGSGTIGGLFDDVFATIGAVIDLPLFDGGRRRAEIGAAEAEADARFAEYRRTFLVALGEVEDSLVAIESYRDRNEELRRAISESQTAFEQSNALYREGLASLFDVLDAQRQLIASREALIDSEAALASSVVSFYAAVGAQVVPDEIAVAE